MTQDNTSSFPVQFQGQVWAQWLLRLAGWRYRFDGLPSQQGVFIAYPHTSNWDFVVMILVKWATGIRTQFWAKDSLFRVPLLGPWLRWVGGVAIDRKACSGVVGEMIRVLRQHKDEGKYFWLALSPEGTRQHTEGWRSGFYQTAFQAGVPICLVRLDYGRKELVATHFYRLSGDMAADMAVIADSFAGVQGYRPNDASPVVLLASAPDSAAKTPLSSGASPHV